MTRSLVIARHNARLLLSDPGPVVLFIFAPLLSMAILKPTFREVLTSQGFAKANGSEQVVPGFITFFVFFWIVFIGRNFFAEHGWGTWDRLQASEASPAELLVGKVIPAFFVILAQMLLLFAIGALLLNLHSAGSVVTLLLPAVALALCVLTLTLAFVGLCRSMTQVDAGGNLLTMVLASLGGALAPVSELPTFFRHIAPATPTYWANKAATAVLLQGHGLSKVLAPTGVILLFAVAFALLAAASYRVSAVKVFTA